MFDLKGSTIGRAKRRRESVSKCNDMRSREGGAFKLVDKAELEALLGVIEKDTAFLEKRGVIDYSLLVGAGEEGEEGEEEGERENDKQNKKNRQLTWSDATFGAHFAKLQEEELNALSYREDQGFELEGGSGVLFVGIIDVLQKFNCRKWFESVGKRVWNRKQGKKAPSCVNPKLFRERFNEFLREVVLK